MFTKATFEGEKLQLKIAMISMNQRCCWPKINMKNYSLLLCLLQLKVLSMVHHENIVEFLGFAEQSIHCAYVMGEFHFIWSCMYDF